MAKWQTPIRMAHLNKICLQDWNVDIMTGEISNSRMGKCKANWISADREDIVANYRVEYDLRHNVRDRLPLRGQFSGISKDIFYDCQSMYDIESLGVSAVTHRSFAKIRLLSSNTRIYVDLTGALSPLSKNAKHKAIRYASKGIIQDIIDTACYKAVKAYLG
jgi:hypothetical protein